MNEKFRETPAYKKWVRKKNRWLARVMFDGSLSPTTRLVAFGIYKHLNDVSHDAWMAQETLRLKLGIGNIKTVRSSIKALWRSGYIAMALDPKTRNYSYEPLFISTDEGDAVLLSQGQSAPMGQGQSAPTVGALSPSWVGALSSKGQGQSAPLSNIINYTKGSNDRGGSVGGALRSMISEGTADDQGVTIDIDPIADSWPLVKAAVIGKHGDRAKSFLDHLRIRGREHHDIVLTGTGSFYIDTINREYRSTLVAAWKAEHSWVHDVRLILSAREAAQ